MKKLYRFILSSYIGPFVLTFFISMFILLMQFLWRYIDELVGKGLEFSVIAELLMYACCSLVPMALPLAVLLSSIMTFGNLAEHNELVAIKSAGISLIQIMRPLIIFVMLLSAGAFFFSNNVMPYTNLKMSTLLWDVKHQKPEAVIKEGVFSDAIEGYTIKVAHKSRTSPMLYNIMIYNHTQENGNRDVTVADSGTMLMTDDKHFLVLTLYNGIQYVDEVEKHKSWNSREFPQRIVHFDEQRFQIDLSGLGFERSDESLFKNHYGMLNLNQLGHTTDSLNGKLQNHKTEFVTKYTNENVFRKVYRQKDTAWYSVDTVPVNVAFNFDSVYKHMNNSERAMVVSYAFEHAREAKSYITSLGSDLKRQVKTIKRYEIEWHRKFTLSIACLLLFFIGAPLGAIIRKGGIGTPIVIAVLFFVLYYVINISGEKAAKTGAWPAAMGMWLSTVVLTPLGVFLTYKAIRDAAILEKSTYYIFFQKLRRKMEASPIWCKLLIPFDYVESKLKKKKENAQPVK